MLTRETRNVAIGQKLIKHSTLKAMRPIIDSVLTNLGGRVTRIAGGQILITCPGGDKRKIRTAMKQAGLGQIICNYHV